MNKNTLFILLSILIFFISIYLIRYFIIKKKYESNIISNEKNNIKEQNDIEEQNDIVEQNDIFEQNDIEEQNDIFEQNDIEEQNDIKKENDIKEPNNFINILRKNILF